MLFLGLMHGAAQAQQPVATMTVSDAKVTGTFEVQGQTMRLSSGSGVEAGNTGVDLQLTRGGELKVCSNSAVHLASGGDPSEMTFSLDHGAMELHSALGRLSDVVLTPDLRVLLSGPGTANVSLRINQQGDTCVDNAVASGNEDAPYVTVTEQLGEGVYRVQAGQRVMLEHGSVSAVVDHEADPCGCPPAIKTDDAQAFPLAQSEGLAPSPPAPKEPVVPMGQVHAQATIPFVFNGEHPPQDQPSDQLPPATTATTAPPEPKKQSGNRIWRAVRGFFHKLVSQGADTDGG